MRYIYAIYLYYIHTNWEQDSPVIASWLNHHPTNVFHGQILNSCLHLQLRQGRRTLFYTPKTFWSFNNTKQKRKGSTCVHVHPWPSNLVVRPNIQPVSSIGLRNRPCIFYMYVAYNYCNNISRSVHCNWVRMCIF
jgi:hypothetical protein